MPVPSNCTFNPNRSAIKTASLAPNPVISGTMDAFGIAVYPAYTGGYVRIKRAVCDLAYPVHLSDKYADTPSTQASKLMLTTAGVKLTRMHPDIDQLVLDFKVAK